MKPIEQQIAETPSLAAADNYSVRERQWRAPSVAEDEEIIFEEPGRVLSRGTGNAVCCRSHYFRVTKSKGSFYTLKVKHGGGEERCSLKYDKRIIDVMESMDSDSRFWLLFTFMDVKSKAEADTADAVNSKWRKAAAQKRIKTRKVRDGVKVWIEPEVIQPAGDVLTTALA